MRTLRGLGARPPSNSFIASSCPRSNYRPSICSDSENPKDLAQPIENRAQRIMRAFDHAAMAFPPLPRSVEFACPEPGPAFARRALIALEVAIGDGPALREPASG